MRRVPQLVAVVLATSVLFEPAGVLAQTQAPYVGRWGVSKQECADREGPNSNTYISRSLFDQYEYHCKIDRLSQTQPTQWALSLRCDENGNKHRARARITLLDRNKLVI